MVRCSVLRGQVGGIPYHGLEHHLSHAPARSIFGKKHLFHMQLFPHITKCVAYNGWKAIYESLIPLGASQRPPGTLAAPSPYAPADTGTQLWRLATRNLAFTSSIDFFISVLLIYNTSITLERRFGTAKFVVSRVLFAFARRSIPA